MDFETFKLNLSILDKDRALFLREKYIERFINIKSETYINNIKDKIRFSDGYCYTGYLWDCLKKPIIIDDNYLKSIVKSIGDVYVFWDIHSCEQIFIEDYWKFDKDDLLELDYQKLIEGECYLPEDIYIFDKKMNWTIIKTHEDIDGQKYCLKSDDI